MAAVPTMSPSSSAGIRTESCGPETRKRAVKHRSRQPVAVSATDDDRTDRQPDVRLTPPVFVGKVVLEHDRRDFGIAQTPLTGSTLNSQNMPVSGGSLDASLSH